MAYDNILHQGDYYKLSEARKLFIGSKSDSWKPKYIIVHIKGNLPVLELHKKKPKASKKSDKTLTDSHELPAFKVEKLKNARGRSFVCEITASNFHLFLSADEEKQIDVLIFFLQTQLRFKDEIRDDIFRVIPESSECQRRIGAKGSNCLLHISPWGLTLVLERSRCLLAQWPLKSIRYYEASGTGLFTIEAGRVAPMGEGIFCFHTLAGDDGVAYDKVDNYIVNTLDRVKPNQRGTKEEIEDYIREHDHLHALTTVSVTFIAQREIQRALKICWDMGSSSDTFTDAVLEPRTTQSSSAESSARNSTASSVTHTSSLNVTLERLNNTSDTASSRSDHSPASSRRSSTHAEANKSPGRSRPPLPGSAGSKSPIKSGVPRRSRRRDHSIPRKIDVIDNAEAFGMSPRLAQRGGRLPDSQNSSPEPPSRSSVISSASLSSTASSQLPPRRHSNPSNVLHSVSNPADPDLNNLLQHYANQNQQQQQQQLQPPPHQHTEFYNLSSPNLKVRKSKSPNVTPKRSKVGRAELLLSTDHSGVRTPSTTSPPAPESRDGSQVDRWDFLSGSHVTDEDHQEAQAYLDAIARASQQKYGHGSIDRSWAKMRRDLSHQDQQDSNPGSPMTPGYVNTFPPTGGYINLQKLASMEERANLASAAHDESGLKRQSSPQSPSSPLNASRQSSRTSQGPDPCISPPVIRHSRQRSAPVGSSVSSFGSVVAASNQNYLESSEKPSDPEMQAVADSHSEISMRSPKKHRQNSEGDLISEDSGRLASQLSGFSTFDQVDEPVAEWLISASCEDLSDHMRQVIYHDGDDDDTNENDMGAKLANGLEKADDEKDDENTYEEIHSDKENNKPDANSSSSSSSNDKPPLPFTGLKKFQNKVDIANSHRDRSKSFGYMNVAQSSSSSAPIAKPQSTAPSAHLIRKMVAARAKQDNTLRKSLSNPNFLNLGSKEHLFIHKSPSGNNNNSGSSSNLQVPNAKQKSRSFGSLFPAIKKAFSRENLGNGNSNNANNRNSRSTTPERWSSFSLRRRSSERRSSEYEFRRRNSLHAVGELTIRGIRMTERSRSFRRVRGAKSVEGLTSPESNNGTGTPDNRLSTATNFSSPPTLNGSEANISVGKSAVNSENADKSRSPSKLRNSTSGAKPASSFEKSPSSSRLSGQSQSVSVSPRPQGFLSGIEVDVRHSSDSMDSMSPAPSPSQLPPPPLPARKPKVSESNQNGTSSLASSTPNSSSSSSVVPPVSFSSQNSKSGSGKSRSPNYMNATSIISAEGGLSDEKRHRQQHPSGATIAVKSKNRISSHNNSHRVSDMKNKIEATEFASYADLTSKLHSHHNSNSRPTSESSTTRVVSSCELPISAAPSKKRTSAKSRSSKKTAKS